MKRLTFMERLRALFPTQREVDLKQALEDLNDVQALGHQIECLGFEADGQALRRAATFASRRVGAALAVHRPNNPEENDA